MNETSGMSVPGEVSARAMRVVARAVQELGGGIELIRHGEQDILPALVESAYVLVLRNEQHYDVDMIAQFLGISPGAVQSVLAAPTESTLARLRYREDPRAEFAWHSAPEWSGMPMENRIEPEFIAGAIAKFAYEIVYREDASRET